MSGDPRPPRRARWRALVTVLLIGIAMTTPTAVRAADGDDAATRAANEIQDARDRADAAAQALFDTESEIDGLEIEIADTEDRLAQVESQANAMRDGLEAQAVREYVGAGGPDFPLLIDLDQTNDVLAADVYASIASETAHVDIDEFDAVMTDVEATRSTLADQRDEARQATETFAAQQVAAEEEVVKLGEIEAQRLQDAAVQRELDRQQAVRDEQARQDRDAQAAADATTAAAAASNQATPAPSSGAADPPTTGGGDGSGNAGGNAAPSPDPAASPEPTPSPDAAPAPAPAPAPTPEAAPPPAPVEPTPSPPDAGSGLVCPVAGPRSFADTWGASRSGGRRHEGVDIISPGGTPLVAMEAGRVEYKSNGLGGNTLRLYGASGTRYYYAHMSSGEGSNRSVSAGEVIGYVGRSGNTTTNHLHPQVHPGGGQPVNPYPYARRACG